MFILKYFSKPSKNTKTITQENSQYEQSILERFFKYGFLHPIETSIEPIRFLQSISYFPSFLDPFLFFLVKSRPRQTTIKKHVNLRNPDMNTSIEPIFHDRVKYKSVLEDPKNELEATWRRRILIENTPRGNIIMYYDAYKEAFAYFSDQTGIPYKILNTAAMKYVLKYRCMDFFLDETIMDNNPSLFIPIHQEELKQENKKKESIIGSTIKSALKDDNSPFMIPKIKQTQQELPVASKGNTKKTAIKNIYQTEEIKMKNKFVYMGKIANFSILQKTPKRFVGLSMDEFTSQYSGMFASQLDAQQNCMNYKLFKALKLKKEEESY